MVLVDRVFRLRFFGMPGSLSRRRCPFGSDSVSKRSATLSEPMNTRTTSFRMSVLETSFISAALPAGELSLAVSPAAMFPAALLLSLGSVTPLVRCRSVSTSLTSPICPAPPARGRKPISRVLGTGVRVIDGLLSLGEGQRVGLFAGSGVGKSTLLGEIARGTTASVVVVALVGERGREVGEFLSETLGEEGRKKSVVVVATSDAPAMERLRAAQAATSIAEHFRDMGRQVLLLVDSVTRFARAQREIGLAAGKPPARRGYPPSVFAMLPRLLERSGQGEQGSITAIYTVLVEGGDMDEPIADEVRGILDGHIVLDRTVASRGHYPAVDVLQSLSRVMDGIVSKEHKSAARRMRQMLAAYESKRDLIVLGAYARGSDPRVDEAIQKMPRIEAFLQQNSDELVSFEHVVRDLVSAVR